MDNDRSTGLLDLVREETLLSEELARRGLTKILEVSPIEFGMISLQLPRPCTELTLVDMKKVDPSYNMVASDIYGVYVKGIPEGDGK